jgi:hypothetical protein
MGFIFHFDDDDYPEPKSEGTLNLERKFEENDKFVTK